MLDTNGVVVANLNAGKWKSLGNLMITGDAYIGAVISKDTILTYSRLTLGSVYTIPVITPTLNQVLTRTMPEDFFGFNGNNMIKSDQNGIALQSWELINDNDITNSKKYMWDKNVTLIRTPAGTTSNYSDWRTGYPIFEKDLPQGWKYEQNAYTLPMNRAGNGLDHLAANLSKITARPIIALNMLTSKFDFELASLYRYNELNIPVSYVELGNEFYLSNAHYHEKFGSVTHYMNMAKDWSAKIKDIPEFASCKIAVVGAIATQGSAGRQRLWLDQVLSELKNNADVDAITLHNYIRSSNNAQAGCVGSLAPAGLEDFLNEAFENASQLMQNELFKIRFYNIREVHNKEAWITEYNLDDDKDVRTGTWAHGLINALATLKYLESRDVTKVISHTMLSGAKYGNIFENDDAFRFLPCHGGPMVSNPNQANLILTAEVEKSAIGTALDAVAYVVKGSTSATPIVFNDARGLGPGTSSELYGWKFESTITGLQNSIIINAGSQPYFLDLTTIFPGLSPNDLTARSIHAYNNAWVITHDPVTSQPTDPSHYLKQNNFPWRQNNLLDVPAFSLVVLKAKSTANTRITARVTDQEICKNSTTTLEIESDIPPTPTVSFGLLSPPISLGNNRYLYTVDPNNSTGNLVITPCTGCSTITVVVHDNLTNLQITSTSHTINNDEVEFCPGSAGIDLTAAFTSGTGGNNSLPYSFLWAPDSGMTFSPCNNSPMCSTLTVAPTRTTNYTVYVTDGQCWASKSVNVIVTANEVNLGTDLQVCSNTSITLNSTYIDPDPTTAPILIWSDGTTSTQGSSVTLTPTSPQTITLTVTDDLCTVSDEINVDMISCCTNIPTGDVIIEPAIQSFSNNIGNAYYSTAEALAVACSTAGYTIKYFDKNGNLITNPSSVIKANVEIDGTSVPSKNIFVNGELRIQNDYFDNPSNTIPDIDGLGLILKNCNIKFAENAGIYIEYGQLKMENCTLEACSNEMWKGIYAAGLGPKDQLPVEIKYCMIKDAIQAFDLKNDVPFSFTGNIFENNNSDVLLTNYFGAIPSDVIINNKFNATGLLSPYSSQQKFAAIQLVNIKNITIGEAVSGSENEFMNSLYGLKSENASFKLLNNTFKEIGDLTNSTTPGACIYASSEFDYSDREINIGNGSNAARNVFESSTNGVIIDGETNLYIKNNVFGNSSSYSKKIRDYSIKAENIGKMNLEISSINSFYDYKYGIWLSNSKTYKSFLINNNDFYNFDAGISSTANYEGTAITILQPFSTIVPNAEISDNKIGRFNSAQTQPRNGIVVSMMKNIKVSLNTIKYKVDNLSPTFTYHGIWLQQCDYARLIDNEITNTFATFPSQIGTFLTGIEMNDCNNTCIEFSEINKMGVGMRFTGYCNVQSLYANEINNYDTAYYVDQAFIGSSVGRGSPPIVMNNKWTRTGSLLTSGRVEGLTIGQYPGQGGVPIEWYYQFSATGEYTPTGQIVSATLLSSYASQSLCPTSTIYIDFDDPPYTSNLRNANYGPVVGDSARYPEEYESNFRALARSALYLTLKRNPEILRMDDPADEAFVEFYNNIAVQNIQFFDSVMTLIQEEKYDEAAVLNESIVDTTTIDEKLKVSLRMYLKTMQPDSMLSAADSAQLLEIAYLNPLNFGTGVYIARNLLNLEIYDDNSGSYRLRSAKVENKPFSILIQPNPGRDYISIICSDGDTPDLIRVQTIEGKDIDLPIANSIVDISLLRPGMYLCCVSKSGNKVIKKFIKQ